MWNLHYFTAISLGPFGPENISQLHTTLMLVAVRDKDLFLPQNEEKDRSGGAFLKCCGHYAFSRGSQTTEIRFSLFAIELPGGERPDQQSRSRRVPRIGRRKQESHGGTWDPSRRRYEIR